MGNDQTPLAARVAAARANARSLSLRAAQLTRDLDKIAADLAPVLGDAAVLADDRAMGEPR